ncbi:zinc finger BED domain-containing protein DAYSLEEPER-like [Euphorbia lathyris]|uniref:zinc finger BED domain-containing protein DAYSLEEPER-like n=1 Tax=Euphorbia lathyris TaxID=212925 RepID=UPI003313DF5C
MPIGRNSTFKMLDNVLYYKDALISFCGRDHGMKCYSLSSVEWDNVTYIHKFFNTFYDVTCMFSAVRTPTANVYFVGVWLIQKALLKAAHGESNVLTDIVDSMQGQFNKYWLEYNEVLSCAALLDPQYKEKFLGYCYTKIYGKDNALSYVAKVVGNLHALFEEYKYSNSMTSGARLSSSNKNSIGGKTSEIYSDYEMFIFETSFCLEKSQLDLYLAEPTHKLDEDLDVLDFWHKSSMRYLELARMAQDILAIPISTVASESAFST